MTSRVATLSAAVLSFIGAIAPASGQIVTKPTVTVSVSQASVPENPNAVTRTTSTTSLSTTSTGSAVFTVRTDIAVPVDVSIPYTVSGTAVAGRDYRALTGSVLIRAGQTTGTITVTSIDDSEDEADETIIVAILSTSSSPYTVGRPGSASTTIIDDDQVSIVGASFDPEIVLGGESSDLRVTLSGPAPPGGLAVRVASYNTASVSDGRTTIPAGAQEGTVTLTTTPQLSNTTTQVTVDEPNGSSVLAYLAVLPEPAVTWVVFAESETYGGGSTTAYVQINTGSTPGGASFPVSVAVLSPGGVTSPLNAPSTVTIAEGSISTRMSIPTAAVTTLTRVAMTVGSGTRTFTDTLTVHPAPIVESISVTPGAVGSAEPVDVTVRMVAPVPAVTGGWTVYLSGSGPVNVSSGASLAFAPGATEATMQFQTPSVAVETEAIVRVSDSPGGTATQEARFRVAPPTVTGVRLGFTETFGGRSLTGEVLLSAPAPATGLTVPIRVGVVGSAKSIPPVSAPKSVTFAPRATTALLNLETESVTSPTEVQVVAGGSTATIRLHPSPRIASITATPDPITGGGNISIRVQLDRPNPIATRFYVAVEASGPLGSTTPLLRATTNSAGYRVGGLPFEFDEREASFSFATEAVAVTTTVEIRFEDIYDASNSAVATLQVAPPSVEPFTFYAEEVFGGEQTQAVLRLNADAPVGGLTVPVTLTVPAGGALPVSAPASVTFPEGTRQANLEIETQPVAAVTAVQVDVGGSAATVAVHPTPRIESVTATPDPVPGGSNVTILVRLDRPNPISRRVYVAVNQTGPLSLTVTPALRAVAYSGRRAGAVTFSQGEREASFALETKAVTAVTPAEIRFEDIFDPLNSDVLNFDVIPKPPATFSALTIDPARIAGAAAARAQLVVTEPPSADVLVNLTSDRPQTGTVPPSVVIPAGATTATFSVVTSDVASTETVRITASNGNQQIAQTLTVDPAPPTIQDLVPTPSDVIGGGEVELAVTLTKPAAPGGYTVALQSSDPSLVPPPAMQIPAGQLTGTVRARTAAVPADRFVRLGLPRTPAANIALHPLQLDRVQTPGSVRGGGVVSVEVRLVAAAPSGGLRVPLASSDASVAAVPAFVDIPAGSLSASVPVQLSTVAADTQVTITAGVGPGAASRQFRVRS